MRYDKVFTIVVMTFVLIMGVTCSEPGPAEKAGKAIDEAVEKIKHGDEGEHGGVLRPAWFHGSLLCLRDQG